MIRTEIDSLPSELDAASRRVMQMEIEEAALKREADAASAERLKALQKELQEARAEADALRAQYEAGESRKNVDRRKYSRNQFSRFH